MSLVEIKLEKPALKRTEIVEDPEARSQIEIEDDPEQGDEAKESSEGGPGKGRLVLAVMMVVGTVLAARRLKSWRAGGEEGAAIEFGRDEEEERPSTT